jgi:hypothetical protein
MARLTIDRLFGNIWVRVRVMVFNIPFNNISIISPNVTFPATFPTFVV